MQYARVAVMQAAGEGIEDKGDGRMIDDGWHL